MKKKILAGVIAMLMAVFALMTSVTVSAADSMRTVGNVQIIRNAAGNIEITSENLFEYLGVDAGADTLNIDMSGVKHAALELAEGSLDGKTVILNAPSSSTAKLFNYVNLANINFKDDLITCVGPSFAAYCRSLRTVSLGSKIDTIGESAFSNCDHLQHTMANPLDLSNIVTIEYSAFSDAPELIGIKFSEGLSSIADSAFSNDAAIKTLAFPSTLQRIGNKAFSGCKGLESIRFRGNDTLTNIGSSAFMNCTSLTAVTVAGFNYNKLPNGQDINCGSSVFKGCTSLQNFTWSSNFTSLPDETFSGCSALTKFTFEDGTGGSSCTVIGQSAFDGCSSLGEISVPDGVTTLNDYTFRNCGKLKDVIVSRRLGIIGTDNGCVFQNCTSLESFTPSNKEKLPYTLQFPASLGGVQKSVFENCPSFKYINFAANSQFSVVGEYAFNKCTGLQGSNEGGNADNTLIMPAGVHDIFRNAFSECTSLEKIEFLGNVSTIGISAFEKCTSLEEIIMNDTVQQVRDSAFADCTSLKKMPHTKSGTTALSHIDTINAYTFKNCTSLEDAFIPGKVSVINDKAFAGCETMTKVLWEKGAALAAIGQSAFSGDEALAVFTSEDGASDSTFPDSLTKIDANAFTKTALTKIIAGTPANGDKLLLGEGAFSSIEALDTVDFSKSNIIEIPKGCFSKDTNLKTVYLPETSLVKIGDSAFADCSFLHTLGTTSANAGEYTIPESLTMIGSKAFENNCCMQVLNLPASATGLSMPIFNICLTQEEIEKNGYTPLEAVNVDENNPSYSSSDGILFNKDQSVLVCRPAGKSGESYTVPSSVTAVGPYAFYGSSKLKSITIPSSVNEIGKQAFSGSDHLNSLYFTGKKAQWSKVTTGDSWSGSSGLGDAPAAKQITFKVDNGKWDDGTTEDQVITVVGNNAIRLIEAFIPAVGNKPDENYLAGSWNNDPLKTDLTGDTVFMYAYAKTKKTKLTITVKELSFVYDGEPKGYDGVVLSDPEKIREAVSVDGLLEGDSLTGIVLSGTETDAGEYKGILTADGAVVGNNTEKYDIEYIAAKLMIAKRTVTLTSEGGSKPYDGTPLTKPEVTGWEQDSEKNTGFVTGEVIDVKATGSVMTVDDGEVTNTITYTEGKNFKADNYNITKTEGKLKITAIDVVTVTIVGNHNETVYDAAEHSISGYEAKTDNELYDVTKDFTFTGTAEAKRTDVGKTYMDLKPEQFENSNPFFAGVTFIVTDGYQEITEVDKTALNQAIGDAEKFIERIRETHGAIADKLIEAIDEAKAVSGEKNVTEEKVKKAEEKIEEALNAAKTLASDKDGFEKLKEDAISEMADLSEPDDSEEIISLIRCAIEEVDALEYDEEINADENNDRILKIVSDLEKDLAAQRSRGYEYDKSSEAELRKDRRRQQRLKEEEIAHHAAEEAASPFDDVTEADPYYEDVMYVYENNIMCGVGNRLFNPGGDLTRGMIVTVLYGMEGKPEVPAVQVFDDVPLGEWYSDSVSWAASKGIVNGFGNGKYGPDSPVTREQLAAILYGYAKFKEYDVSVGEGTNILSYDDAFTWGEWAVPALQWACGAALLEDSPVGMLRPTEAAKRSEIAHVLHVFMEDVAK